MFAQNRNKRPSDILTRIGMQPNLSQADIEDLQAVAAEMNQKFSDGNYTNAPVDITTEYFPKHAKLQSHTILNAFNGTRLTFSFKANGLSISLYIDSAGNLVGREYFDKGNIKIGDIPRLISGLESNLRSGPKSNEDYDRSVYARVASRQDWVQPDFPGEQITKKTTLAQIALEDGLVDDPDREDLEPVVQRLWKSYQRGKKLSENN